MTKQRRETHHVHSLVSILKVGWQGQPLATAAFLVGAALESGSFLGTLYASAKLSALLAHFVTTHETAGVWLWLWIDIGFGVTTALGFWLMGWARRLIYFSIVQWSTHTYQQALCRLDIADFYDDKLRNRINKVQNGYTWQMPNLNGAALELVYAILRFVVTAVIVAKIAWWLIPIIALFLVPSLLAERKMAIIEWFIWDENGDDRHIFWGLDYILRQAKNQMELRSSQARSYIMKRLDTMTARFYVRQRKQVNQGYALLGPAKVLEAGSTVIGAIILLRQFLHGVIGLQQYFFLSGALLRVSSSLTTIFSTLSRLQEPLVFADDFYKLIDHESKVIDRPNALSLPETQTAPRIEFRDVTFAYPKQSKPVFDHLSLTVEPGEHIAIVGENGAGKSTLIKLLLRFYRPDSGEILIDGLNLQDITIESWYGHLATLFQDFNQYPLSIRENIEIGQADVGHNKTKLIKAANSANVNELIDAYPYGWDTVLDNSFEKGIEPSGGQWQRIALARTFYRNAPVLILDEPTSAIDAKAEYDIFNNIFDHYQYRSVIIVSHRFSTVRRAHRIVVINEGKIVEQGSHHELMDLCGLYHDMFTKQAEGYQ